jgi:hypothetical protein
MFVGKVHGPSDSKFMKLRTGTNDELSNTAMGPEVPQISPSSFVISRN